MLEDAEHSGRLRSYDAQLLEMLVLVSNPHSQSLASQNWAFLSPERRRCKDLLAELQDLVASKLPVETKSSHPLLGQLEAATAHLAKVRLTAKLLICPSPHQLCFLCVQETIAKRELLLLERYF
jgi:hypothetical protein